LGIEKPKVVWYYKEEMFKDIWHLIKTRYLVFLAFVVMLGFFALISAKINNFLVYSLLNKNIITSKDDMLVHFISVGEADAVAINFPNGDVALVDTGLNETATEVVGYIKNNVLSRAKDKDIDCLFFTHADNDHIGGGEIILDSFNVKKVVRSRQYTSFEKEDAFGQVVDTSSYNSLVVKIHQEIKQENFLVAVDGMSFAFGNALVSIYYPLVKYSESNDYSYFLKIVYKNKSVLIAGDATVRAEKDVLEMYPESLKSDIFKLNHHGSSTSNCKEFLDAVRPKFAVVSSGENNYGHPAGVVISRLHSYGCEIYNTNQNGNILAVVNDRIKFFSGEYYISSFDQSYIMIEAVVLIVFDIAIVVEIVKVFKLNKNKIVIDDDDIVTY